MTMQNLCRRALSIGIRLLFCTTLFTAACALDKPSMHFSTYGAGDGPLLTGGMYRLLELEGSPRQSNALAFDVAQEGLFEHIALHCKLRVLEGGDGGSIIFLNTAEYGRRGPAPFIKNWVAPDLTRSFAVGVDVHNPPSEDPFDEHGNYLGLPQREISLHWDGREIVKQLSPLEFRGESVDLEIFIDHVIGGAEVTVKLDGLAIYDAYFIAGMQPYESRLAFGAGTREEIATGFDVRDIVYILSGPAEARRRPKHFTLFNHVMVGDLVASRDTEITLPPANWAFGRVILTIELHDAGQDWDEWDRNGSLSVVRPGGAKYDIAPFITSFRTPGSWTVDVTHFRPWLAEKVNFEVATTSPLGDGRGFMLSASLDYYHGTQPLEPFRIVPLWNGTAAYGSDDNPFGDFYMPQTVHIDEQTEAAELYITTTGHSPVGEFTPSQRALIIAPDTETSGSAKIRFEDILWKNDNYLNPVRPQRGTWKFARAGWAPGDVVRPWRIDLTPYAIPGNTVALRYEPQPYDFSDRPEDQRPSAEELSQAVHLVRSFVVLYRSQQDQVTAPTLQVLEVLPDSNASRAGILPNDYVASYEGQRPETIEELRAAIREAEATGKQRAKTTIFRGGQQLEIEIGTGQMGVMLGEEQTFIR